MTNLSLNVQLNAFDRVSKQFKKIGMLGKRLEKTFNADLASMKKLNQQMKDIASYRKHQKAVQETQASLDEMRERAKQLHFQLKNSGANKSAKQMERLRREYTQSKNKAEQLESALTRYRLNLNKSRNSLQKAKINTRNLSAEEQRLKVNAEKLNHTLTIQHSKLERLSRVHEKFKKAQNLNQKFNNMRNQSVGMAFAGGASVYGGSQFIKPGVEFEQALSKVQALTRLDKNSPQLKALENQAKKLGAITQFTAADAARGQAFLAMAGFTPESIKSAMPGMLDLALAGGIELPQVADIASNILSGMNLDASQMNRVADVLSGAFTRANLNIEMLGETMKYAAPGAEGLGVSLEEVAAMAGKLGDAGIQGSIGGTALRSIMSRLASGPPKAAKALAQLGIQAADANGNLRSMPSILTELYEKTKNLGNAKRQGLFKAIGGEEASNSLKILVDQAGSGELQKLVATLKNANGEAANLAKTMSDNTVGDYKTMQSAADALKTSIYDSNKDAIRGFMQSLTELIVKLTTFANAHPELMSMMGKMFGMLAIGALLIGTLGATMLTILGPMALLHASLSVLGLPKTLTPLGLLTKGFKKLGQGIMWVGRILMANPIFLAFGLLAVAAWMLYKNWDDVVGGAKLVWQDFTNFLGRFKLVQVMRGGIVGLLEWWTTLWHNIQNSPNAAILQITQALINWSPLGIIYRVFAGVMNYLGFEMPSTLFGFFVQIGQKIADAISNWSPIIWLQGVFASAFSWISAQFDGVLGKIAQVTRAFSSFKNFKAGVTGLFSGVNVVDNRKGVSSPARGNVSHGPTHVKVNVTQSNATPADISRAVSSGIQSANKQKSTRNLRRLHD